MRRATCSLRRIPRVESAGGGGIGGWLDADGEGGDGAVERCGGRLGRSASITLGRSLEIAVFTASWYSGAGAAGERGGLGLGPTMLSFSVGLVGMCSGHGERRTRFGVGDEGARLVETVTCKSVVVDAIWTRGAHHVWDACCSPRRMEVAPHLRS